MEEEVLATGKTSMNSGGSPWPGGCNRVLLLPYALLGAMSMKLVNGTRFSQAGEKYYHSEKYSYYFYRPIIHYFYRPIIQYFL